MQQFYPTLTETQTTILNPARFRACFRALTKAKDVTWCARDPWPFVTMPVTAFQIISAAVTTRRSFGEVSTEDISWFDDPA